MENIRKHRNIKLVTTEEKYLRTVMKPNFKSGVLFGENLMGCEVGKIKVVMLSYVKARFRFYIRTILRGTSMMITDTDNDQLNY